MNIEVVSGRDRLNRVCHQKKITVVIARRNDCETNKVPIIMLCTITINIT